MAPLGRGRRSTLIPRCSCLRRRVVPSVLWLQRLCVISNPRPRPPNPHSPTQPQPLKTAHYHRQFALICRSNGLSSQYPIAAISTIDVHASASVILLRQLVGVISTCISKTLWWHCGGLILGNGFESLWNNLAILSSTGGEPNGTSGSGFS